MGIEGLKRALGLEPTALCLGRMLLMMIRYESPLVKGLGAAHAIAQICRESGSESKLPS